LKNEALTLYLLTKSLRIILYYFKGNQQALILKQVLDKNFSNHLKEKN